MRLLDSHDAPLVSVIVPTFDRPDYLQAALRSAVAQTCRSIEIVVQDNASKIDPRNIVAAFGDPRVAYYRNDVNVSQAENIVSACARARGKYLAILGDDDLWEPEFVAALVAPLEADESLVVAFCDHDIIDAEGRLDGPTADRITRLYGRDKLRTGVYRPFDDIALVHRSICAVSAAVYRRSAIDWKAIPLDLGFGPIDHYISYLAVRTGMGCYYVSRRLAHYRYHRAALGSSLTRPERRIENAQYAMRFWSRLAGDNGLRRRRRYFEMKLAFNALIIVANLVRERDWRTAMRELRQCWAAGLIRPRIFVDYCAYALWLRRVTA